MVGLALLARAGNRFGFSPIPLYLLAGLSIGEGGLVPIVTAEGFIAAGAEIGVVLLLFMLGLEYSASELAESLKRSAWAGLFDFVANFTPGLIAGWVLGFGTVPGILLGGITYMSSTGVIAKLLGDLEWIGNRETPGVLSILVIEDLLMALYLPIAGVLLLDSGVQSGIVAVAIALGVVAVILLFAIRWGASVSRLVISNSDEVLLLTLFGLILVVAGIGQAARISAAVGAFLVGIALSGPAAERARALLAPLRDLFAAVFFVFFGLRVHPVSIPPVAVAAIVLAVITAGTKMATGWWIGRREGLGRNAQLRAGTALVARGEFSIAIAEIGVASGLGERFGALAAAYVLALGLAGPLLARFASRRTRNPWHEQFDVP